MSTTGEASTPSTLPAVAPHTRRRWIVSVDLGQSIDPTAVAVLEVVTRGAVRDAYWDAPPEMRPQLWEPPREWYKQYPRELVLQHPETAARIAVRHLNRLPLRMSYPDQVAHVAKLLKLPPLDRVHPELIVDATGVGRPVVELLERAGLHPISCTITAGNSEAKGRNSRDWHVAKLLLVSRLQSVLHERVLNIANVPDAETLANELQDFRGIFSETGYARFGAREGAHDDLVLAVAIGVWWACRPRQGAYTTMFRV
jgi:hypothetical protein